MAEMQRVMDKLKTNAISEEKKKMVLEEERNEWKRGREEEKATGNGDFMGDVRKKNNLAQ